MKHFLRIAGMNMVTVILWMCCVLMIIFETNQSVDTEWSETVTDNIENEDVEVRQQSESIPEKEENTLRCHRRLYKAQIEQKDQDGRRCWDTLYLDACWGRCDSHEISEWKFPYKKSKHPVCGFGARVENIAILQNCEEGADPETRFYKHVRPVNCRCRICSSTDTSCGWLPLH